MPRSHSPRNSVAPFALQPAIDAVDVVGVWECDVVRDQVHADPLVAMLFGVDPELAAEGTSLSMFEEGMHPEDRGRIINLIHQVAHDGGTFIAEYRVCSSDGITRWILARGHFYRDSTGAPTSGNGIIIDITKTRGVKEAYLTHLGASPATPLRQTAEHAIALHESAVLLGDPIILQIAKTLLLRLGMQLNEEYQIDRRRAMN